MLKVLHVNTSAHNGGAARAAFRIVLGQRKHGLDSKLLVMDQYESHPAILRPGSEFSVVSRKIRSYLSNRVLRLQHSDNSSAHSLNMLPGGLAKWINSSDADVVNLHWVGLEMLSIGEIGRINKPICWTMHDMWPFSGAEHYDDLEAPFRYVPGYEASSRPLSYSGMDLDAWVWRRKKKLWAGKTFHLICPSRWLAECASSSELMKSSPTHVIPNSLDLDTYKPLDKDLCRQAYNLPMHRPVILFGAIGGGKDPRKGYDLLLECLNILGDKLQSLDERDKPLCVVFGQNEPAEKSAIPFPVRWVGHLHDDQALALLYNAADVVVVPSRQENLPQTVTEPQACGCPVVAFNCTGFSDAVVDRVSGYLANAYDVEELADGICWVLEDDQRRKSLGAAAREWALKAWSDQAVVPQYMEVYRQAMAAWGQSV